MMSRQDFTFRRLTAVNVYVCPQGKLLHHDGAGSMMARRFYISMPGPRIVALARSRQGAARRHPSAKSRAASTRPLAMLPGRWPALKRSSDRAAIANGSRCCSPISNAFSSSVAFGFVARAAHRTSSRWPPSPQNLRRLARLIARATADSARSLSCLGNADDTIPQAIPTPPHEGRPINHSFSKSRRSPRHSLSAPTSATKSVRRVGFLMAATKSALPRKQT